MPPSNPSSTIARRAGLAARRTLSPYIPGTTDARPRGKALFRPPATSISSVRSHDPPRASHPKAAFGDHVQIGGGRAQQPEDSLSMKSLGREVAVDDDNPSRRVIPAAEVARRGANDDNLDMGRIRRARQTLRPCRANAPQSPDGENDRKELVTLACPNLGLPSGSLPFGESGKSSARGRQFRSQQTGCSREIGGRRLPPLLPT